PVSTFVDDNLSDSTRTLIGQNSNGDLEGQEKALADDLNKIIHGPTIYDAQRFADVKLQVSTKQLISQDSKEKSVVKLNRALLEDAYAGEITKYVVPYWIFLSGLFVVGLGFAMLQIAANPYVTILGPEATAPSRLNLSQAFNSFGTTIGPIIGGWLIFTFFTSKDAHGADSVKIPYLCFAGVFVLLAVFFKFAH